MTTSLEVEKIDVLGGIAGQDLFPITAVLEGRDAVALPGHRRCAEVMQQPLDAVRRVITCHGTNQYIVSKAS